jgi:hypothetical protein
LATIWSKYSRGWAAGEQSPRVEQVLLHLATEDLQRRAVALVAIPHKSPVLDQVNQTPPTASCRFLADRALQCKRNYMTDFPV